MIATVAFGDGDDQLLPDVTRKVEIDVRDRVELAVEETPEREVGRDGALDLQDTRGMEYNPLTKRYRLSGDTSVNYLMACRKAGVAPGRM